MTTDPLTEIRHRARPTRCHLAVYCCAARVLSVVQLAVSAELPDRDCTLKYPRAGSAPSPGALVRRYADRREYLASARQANL